MERNKLLALSAAAVATLAVVAFGLGTAQAATWHDYKGDIFAGHAYGLQVPAGAEAYEAVLSGEPNASAKLAVFDPAGERVGYYELSSSLTSASVVDPVAGRHMLYVYDLVGSLSLRVDADSEPALDLQKVQLLREDLTLADQDAAGKVDKVLTKKLSAAPVFVTLLYEGSAVNLDATVASAKGDAVTIRGETGTAFSPGVWTSQRGERSSNPAHIEGTAYTVTVHAERFEGTLVLTALSLDLRAPPAAPPLAPRGQVPAAPHHAPHAKHPAAVPSVDNAFLLEEGKPVAFTAEAGKLLLALAVKNDKEDENYGPGRASVSIYSPGDEVIAFMHLDREEPNASVELPIAGEYVAFVHESGSADLVARLSSGARVANVRELPLDSEEFEVALSSGKAASPIVLEHAPIALKLALRDATGVLGSARIANEKGVVAEAQALVAVPFAEFLTWSHTDPENFAAGEHALTVDGLLEGTAHVVSVHYLRSGEPTQPVKAEAEHEPPGIPFASPLVDLPVADASWAVSLL